MYTSFSKHFKEKDKTWVKAFLREYREKFIKMYFGDKNTFSDNEKDLLLGSRTNSDEEVFQALCQNIEKEWCEFKIKNPATTEENFIDIFMLEIDNREFREHKFQNAYLNASSCDWYYTFEKDYGHYSESAELSSSPEEE